MMIRLNTIIKMVMYVLKKKKYDMFYNVRYKRGHYI